MIFDKKLWHDVSVQTFATVIAAALLTVLSAIYVSVKGWWPTVWAALRAFPHLFGQWLAYERRIPVALIVVLVGGLLLLVWRLRRRLGQTEERARVAQEREAAAEARDAERVALRENKRLQVEAAAAAAEAVSAMSAAPQERGELQENILKYLAGTPRGTERPSYLPIRVMAGELLVEQAIRKLEAAGLVKQSLSLYGGESSVWLTDQGRDYVIERGYAPDRPTGRL